MKSVILFFSMLMVSFTTIASNSISEGNWYNPHLKRSIYITSYHDGIKVKGIHSRYGSTWFEKCGRNTYCDRYDNYFKVSGRDRLVFYKRDGRVRLTFYPTRSNDCEPRSRYDDRDDDWYSDDRRYDDGYGDDDYNSRNRGKGRVINKRPSYNFSPEGTWQSSDFGKKVFIVDTRDGLKARFSDDSKWYIFKNDDKKSGIYLGDKGHRYEYIDDNLYWIDNVGQRKYKLTKISDAID